MPDGTVNPDAQHDKSRVDWFQEGQEWARRGDSIGASRPGTLEEKLDIMERQHKEQQEAVVGGANWYGRPAVELFANDPPFNRAKERRILKGGLRKPYLALDGTECKTIKVRDKYNREILKQYAAYSKGELVKNPFPWMAADPGATQYGFTPRAVPDQNFQTFEELWDESRTELIEAGGYSFIDGVLRETPPFFAKDGIGVAYVSFTLKRPGLFARLYAAVKEAISG